MIERIYTHNFRCLENFEFKPSGNTSALLVGKNGSGKSTLLQVLKIFQSIGQGVNRVGQLVTPVDFTLNRNSVPMRFELDVKLGAKTYSYTLAFELPDGWRELRVLEEKLVLEGVPLFSRDHATVVLRKGSLSKTGAQFNIDWHLVALPLIQDPAPAGTLSAFRDWLTSIVLLAPNPKLMSGDAERGIQKPDESATNWADWLSGLLDRFPSAYTTLSQHLSKVMPDLEDFRFDFTAKEAKTLLVRFKRDKDRCELPFRVLSDGEKCFFLCAVVLAANLHDGPIFTIWDEPDNHLSLSEVSQFVLALRRGFSEGGQILMTSHNPEAIRRFSNENTWVLGRRSHLEPTVVRKLGELAPTADLIQKLIEGDLDPWA